MKILYLIFALALTGCFGSVAQSPATSESTPAVVAADTIAADTIVVPAPIEHTDINGDGLVDVVTLSENIGSRFSGMVVEITDGKHSWVAENTENDNALLAMFYTDIADKKIRDTVCKLLTPKATREKLDPLGTWIIDAQKNRRNVKNTHFDFVCRPKLAWQANMNVPSESYKVKIEPSIASGLGKKRQRLEGIAAPNKAQGKNAWWVFRKFISLDLPFKEIGMVAGSKIYASGAAVAIEKGGKFAWLFVVDHYAVGSGGSVADVRVEKDRYLIVGLDTGVPVATYIIDIQTGVVAKMRKTIYELDEDPTIIDAVIREYLKL